MNAWEEPEEAIVAYLLYLHRQGTPVRPYWNKLANLYSTNGGGGESLKWLLSRTEESSTDLLLPGRLKKRPSCHPEEIFSGAYDLMRGCERTSEPREPRILEFSWPFSLDVRR